VNSRGKSVADFSQQHHSRAPMKITILFLFLAIASVMAQTNQPAAKPNPAQVAPVKPGVAELAVVQKQIDVLEKQKNEIITLWRAADQKITLELEAGKIDSATASKSREAEKKKLATVVLPIQKEVAQLQAAQTEIREKYNLPQRKAVKKTTLKPSPPAQP